MYWLFVGLAFLRLVPAAYGCYRWKVLPVYMQLMVVVLWLGVLQTALKMYFGLMFGNNLALTHAYAAIELLIIALAYAHFHHTKTAYRIYKKLILPLSCIILLYGYWWLDNPHTFQRLSRVIEGLVIMVMAIHWLNNYKGNAEREGMFWISGALLLFFSCNLMAYLFMEVAHYDSMPHLLLFRNITEVVNLCANVLFTVALWKHTSQPLYSRA